MERSVCDAEAGSDRADVHDSNNDSARVPLLPGDLRQRGTRAADAEAASTISSRILDRSAGFRQSRGRWRVHRLRRDDATTNCCYRWFCLDRVWSDWHVGSWFHRLAYQRTGVLMLILFCVYASVVSFFASLYLGLSLLGQRTETSPDGTERQIPYCHMEINNKMEALYLSLSTMASIGYGVSNYYFGGCWFPFLLVISQVCSAILFDAVAVGLLFHRISRGRKRSRTIAFSDKAVVQRVQNVPHLMFRMGELRKYHLIGSTIRCYCVKHERIPVSSVTDETPSSVTRIETTHFISRQMKLLHPDQTRGADVWMGLPQVIVHRMDEESPLVPNGDWYDGDGELHRVHHSNRTLPKNEDPESPGEKVNLDSITHFFEDRDAEILVLVEGTDEGTGASMQARHSYKVTDLAWNHTFAPCIFPYQDNPGYRQSRGHPVCSIDFSKFHEVVPAPENSQSSPYVPI